MEVEIRLAGRQYRVVAKPDGDGHRVSVTEPVLEGRVERLGENLYRVTTSDGGRRVWVTPGRDGQLHVEVAGEAFEARQAAATRGGRALHDQKPADGRADVRAPMPARVVAVKVKTGGDVVRDQVLVVVEAMKMQLELRAPMAGSVVEVNASEGALTDPSVALVVIQA